MSSNVVSFRSSSDESKKPKVIPERIQMARKALGITQTELASRVGVTRQAISSFELGAKQPEAPNMHRIAEELDQPIAFFVSKKDLSTFGPLSARTYRAFGPSTNKRNDQCDVNAEWAMQIAAYLGEIVNFPSPKIPDIDASSDHYSESEIEEIAEQVRASWGLGVGPIGNLTKLLESRGVFVLDLAITAGNVNAFSYWSGSQPFIILGSDKNTTAVRRRFDLAHELGHLVLHRGIGDEELKVKKKLDIIEAEANRFASAFLMPLRSYPNEVFSNRLESFVELKARWKVAISAQVYRCSDLKIFTDQQVLNLRKQISSRKWRTKEPLDDSIAIEQPKMIKDAAQMALDGGVLSASQIYTDMNLNPNLLQKLTGISSSKFVSTPADIDPPLEFKT